MKNRFAASLDAKRKTRLALALGMVLGLSAAQALATAPATTRPSTLESTQILTRGETSGDSQLRFTAQALGILPRQTANPAATTIIVTNCNDAGSGSLRAAVGFASSGDTVDISGLNCGAVNLNSSIVTFANDLTIKGNPAHKYGISGQSTVRPITHIGTGTLTLDGVKVKFGKIVSSAASAAGGCIWSAGDVVLQNDSAAKYCKAEQTDGYTGATVKALGGAIFANGTVEVNQSAVTNSTATGNGHPALGGGIYAKGGITLSGALISNNKAVVAVASLIAAKGGGLYTPGTLGAKYSSIEGNTASNTIAPGLAWGGGAFVGTAGNGIKYSTIANNSAGSGSGVILASNTGTDPDLILNSTFAGNTAISSISKYGGALSIGGTTTISNSTISGNTEKNSSDIKYGAGVNIGADGNLTLNSSVVSDNRLEESDGDTPASDIGGDADTPASIAGSHNLVGLTTYASVPSDTIRKADPGLGPLADNGGFTKTMAVLPGSPLIDKGNANSTTRDQRGDGFVRVHGAAADIGAFELGGDTIFQNGFD